MLICLLYFSGNFGYLKIKKKFLKLCFHKQLKLQIKTILYGKLTFYQGKKDREGKTEIFVKNLSWNTDDSSLREAFEKYGKVTRINILKRDDGKSKGIGFVCFENASEASSAMDDSNKIEIDGRYLK